MTNSIDTTEDEELDEPELLGMVLDSDDLGEDDYDWAPICIDDCELCGCHGDCDPEDGWRWANEDEEEDD